MTPNERFRLMKERVARIHDAVLQNLIVPVGLPADVRCQIEIVQGPSGVLEATNIVNCHPEALKGALLRAVARTSFPAPLQFPDDPPLARITTILYLTSKDLQAVEPVDPANRPDATGGR
jgi:hypothetical protein